MGLGLKAFSKLKHGLFGYGGDKMLQSLANEALTYCTRHGIESVYQGYVEGKIWYLSLHPAEEPVRFHSDYGEVLMQARTSSAGPGYHAFVVGFLDHCEKALGLSWKIDDETGYAASRDISALRAAMAEDLQQDTESPRSSEYARSEQFALSQPTEFNLVEPSYVARPLGLCDLAFFDNPDPVAWYSWWDDGVTGEVVHRMALCQLWMHVPWHPARDDEEAKILVRAAGLARRAAEMGHPLSEDDERDLATLMDGEELAAPGEPERIGFWRRPRRWSVPDGCSVIMPGYVYRSYEPEASRLRLTYGERAVQMDVYAADDDPTTVAYAEPTGELPWPGLPGRDEHMRLEADDFRAVIFQGDAEIAEGPSLIGLFRGYQRFVIVTITFGFESEIGWAEDVMRSVALETSTEV